MTRTEQYRRARELMSRLDISALLRAAGFDKDKAERAAAELLEATEGRSTCTACRNERVNRRISDSRTLTELCVQCRGNPGARLSADQYVQSLRTEAMLLEGAPDSWAAAALIDDGAPLRDVDPGELAAWFGVDPLRTRWEPPASPLNDGEDWRRGQWVAQDLVSPDQTGVSTPAVPASRPPATP
jgi:hypothetical protein